MHLSAIAYNLKKYLKFTSKTAQSGAKALRNFLTSLKPLFRFKISALASF